MSNYQKRHYEELAALVRGLRTNERMHEALLDAKPIYTSPGFVPPTWQSEAVINVVMDKLRQLLSEDNPRFDWKRFTKACDYAGPAVLRQNMGAFQADALDLKSTPPVSPAEDLNRRIKAGEFSAKV